MMRTKVEIYTRPDNRYDFRIIAAENGNILCSSNQGYDKRSEAINTAKRVLSAGVSVPMAYTGKDAIRSDES